MALLTVSQRKAIFQELGLGAYNKTNIKAFQKRYMLRKADWDGVYGFNTDNTLRTVYYVKKYTNNFKPEEFRCECGGRYCCGYPDYMKPAQLIHMQTIRDHYGKPITVTSGLRCKTWNKKCGGSIQNSLHMKGLATDFYQQGVTDTLKNRRSAVKYIKKLVNHHYTYGNGINSYGNCISATYMGNALHTDTNDKVKPTHPEYTPEPKSYKVIDVSDWQSQIDWAKVKADGVVAAIIRYADGTTLDKRFAENMTNAKKNDIYVGSYIFSRAKTAAEAEVEAERLYNATAEYAPEMPLYIDLEVASLSSYADTVAQAFLNKMDELGGKGGVYANLNWWNNYLKQTFENCSSKAFWIAQYNDEMTHSEPSKFGMWQYTSSGKVNGINGKVDMDKCYRKYWLTAPTPTPPTPTPPTPTPPKKTIDELAREVIAGLWGSGDERKRRLTEAGYDYYAVQKRVNEILEAEQSLATRILNACKIQADWMKNYKYKWQANPTIAKSKKYGTCVTYVACVLQRIGYLASGKCIWHTSKGKVSGATDRMTVYYPSNKTLKQLKGTLKTGDVVMAGDKASVNAGGNSHIFIFAGEWSGDNPYIWDNHSCTLVKKGKNGKHTYSGSKKVIAYIRLKG